MDLPSFQQIFHFHPQLNDISRPDLARRKLLCAGVACAVGPVLGCATDAIEHRLTYTEKINNILAVPERSQLIILGNRYHYSFRDTKSLGRAMSATFAPTLSGAFDNFRVNGDNRISGSYRVLTRHPLRGQEREEARRLGFSELPDGRFEISAEISGTRYTTVPLVATVEPSHLDSSFTIPIDVYDRPPTGTKSSPISEATGAIAELLLLPVVALMFVFLNPCITCK